MPRKKLHKATLTGTIALYKKRKRRAIWRRDTGSLL